MKKTIAVSILSTIFLGIIGWGGSLIAKIPSHDEAISNLKDENKTTKQMLQDIHWFLIKRNNIQPPRGK